MGQTNKVDEVVSAIEHAFAGVTLEDGISISQATVIDDFGSDEERLTARVADEKIDWRAIPDELIALHYTCLIFTDAKGYRFNLPAYLRFVLRNYVECDCNTHNSVFFSLKMVDDPRRALFTAEQEAAVTAFLQFFLTEPHGWFREDAAQALRNWE